ncbi:hypothetical protein AALP_AA4G180700 [Arabis alpina]|uniref:DUF547 domain-containing protein n=1 Tax=Arabis alpina TaxID=50452 RepID=A0A087H405_ARAAL|nr:hypothetical protein AALP_AA4G180700 [Arabis alpina]
MEASQQHNNKRHDLEEGVMHLKEKLEEEEALSRNLQAAFNGSTSIVSLPSLSSPFLPPQFSELIQELALVEAEILCLDRKIEELKLKLYYEQRQTQEINEQKRTLARQNHARHNSLPLRHDLHQRSLSHHYQHSTLDTVTSTHHSRLSFSYAPDFEDATSSGGFTDEFDGLSRTQMGRVRKGLRFVEAKTKDDPNEVSEQLINCLIGIYLELNQVSSKTKEDVTAVSRRPSSCSRKSNTYSYYQNEMDLDPYRVLPESSGGITRDIGPYKSFIHIARSSIDVTRFTHYCSPAVPRLSVLMQKLSEVDLSFLTYKQKLAFWINIYNACIMHAFLEYGLPSSHNRLLTLMNKASLNVGGIVLNALAIEHFVLRHPCEPEHGLLDEKETLLRHTYGLGYSEPNVTFALCRGSWSSPALRVYTADEVVNDLGRARVEYLEASIGVSSKKKIVVPQLLQWHMKDFADDIESLLEWIYSQLPRSGNLKGMVMECLKRKAKVPLAKMVEIQTYGHEFRYLLSL